MLEKNKAIEKEAYFGPLSWIRDSLSQRIHQAFEEETQI